MGFPISTAKRSSLTLFVSLIALCSCAHNPSFNPPQESADGPPAADGKTPPAPVDQTKEQIAKLQERVQDLETRLSALNDKINLENGGPATTAQASAKEAIPPMARPTGIALTNEAVVAPPAHGKVIPVKTASRKSSKGNSQGFASNESVDRFREAKILYDSKKYSDAVLEFSDFVKNEPEHALAPAAQYYLGMSYLNENEFKLAEEEFSRGLLSYPHSSYIPDTLLSLAAVSEKLNKPTKVNYYKEKILSNFPNSPQAKSLSLSAPQTAPVPEARSTAKAETASDEMPGEASVIEKPTAPSAPTLKMEPAKEGGNE